ncbi:hypothetical protein AXG89_19865 [Burkholderia sp. PAMC 26561]|nr:hypothetical protein AXG89_19865 [Burkholderia sp. PAMC 26561]
MCSAEVGWGNAKCRTPPDIGLSVLASETRTLGGIFYGSETKTRDETGTMSTAVMRVARRRCINEMSVARFDENAMNRALCHTPYDGVVFSAHA